MKIESVTLKKCIVEKEKEKKCNEKITRAIADFFQ